MFNKVYNKVLQSQKWKIMILVKEILSCSSSMMSFKTLAKMGLGQSHQLVTVFVKRT
jgi:hypothetical protein